MFGPAFRSSVPPKRLAEFDKAMKEGRGVILAGPGSNIYGVNLANILVIQCDAPTGQSNSPKSSKEPPKMQNTRCAKCDILMEKGEIRPTIGGLDSL